MRISSRVFVCVSYPDLKHRRTLLQFFSTCPSTFPNAKFGFQAAINCGIAEKVRHDVLTESSMTAPKQNRRATL